MAITNAEVADHFLRMADLLEIQGENPFRIRAYRHAAHTVSALPESVAAMIDRGDDLTELPGIGQDLAGKIGEIVTRGRLAALDRLEKRLPGEMAEMLRLPALGPKRVARIHRELRVRTLLDLERACVDHRLGKLPGIGPKTEARVLEALRSAVPLRGRMRLDAAEEIVAPLVEWMRACPAVKECTVAGSLRRRAETVGDLDLVATTHSPEDVFDRFVEWEDVREVTSRGPTRCTLLLRGGVQVDLRVVEPACGGAALLYLTGSKAHNIALRRLAMERGLKINEYGVWRGDERIGGRTETDVYRCLDLPLVEPELREDRGEIEAARDGTLPRLVTQADLAGDLHVHTDATDGVDTLEDIVTGARGAGYDYVAVTDHTAHLTIAHGQDPRRLLRQLAKIDRLNATLHGFTVLKSAEVDILEDGRLDLPDAILSELDLVVGAVHSHFAKTAKEQTERVLRAMDNPYFDILAHPTGRLIGARPPYAIDMEKVLAGALDRGCFVELNAHPERLDASDVLCRRACELGVKVAISTDAHSADGLANMRFGIDTARRAWLEPEDVLNTRSWPELQKMLRKRP